jgi:hypothetical protein
MAVDNSWAVSRHQITLASGVFKAVNLHFVFVGGLLFILSCDKMKSLLNTFPALLDY